MYHGKRSQQKLSEYQSVATQAAVQWCWAWAGSICWSLIIGGGVKFLGCAFHRETYISIYCNSLQKYNITETTADRLPKTETYISYSMIQCYYTTGTTVSTASNSPRRYLTCQGVRSKRNTVYVNTLSSDVIFQMGKISTAWVWFEEVIAL